MKEVRVKVNPEGHVRITKDFDHHYFLAHPKGMINPSLLDEDLEQATHFSENCLHPWTYCTNTEDVYMVNPLNIFFLKEIKKLNNLKEIVIYAPGLVNRLLIKMASPIIKPDRIIHDKTEFEEFLKSMTHHEPIKQNEPGGNAEQGVTNKVSQHKTHHNH